MSGKKELRAGVVGLHMGMHHAAAYQENAHTRLAAVCDLSSDVLDKARERLGPSVQYHTSFEEMLGESKLDVVSVATPNRFHAPLSIQALDHGVHTLCTKPIAPTVAEGHEMLRAAQGSGKTLMIGYQRPLAAPAKHVKALLREDQFGRIYHVEINRTGRKRGHPGMNFLRKEMSGGGPLIDLAIHSIDLVLWLLDHPRGLRVSAVTHGHMLPKRFPEADVEDLAVAHVVFEGGTSLLIRAVYEANLPEEPDRTVALWGDKESVRFDPWSGEMVYGNLESTRTETIKDLSPKKNQQQYSVDAFVDAVRSGEDTTENVLRAIAGLEIVLAAYQSAANGGLSVPLQGV